VWPPGWQETRGYALGTNAALANSGGIHDIGQTWSAGGQDASTLDLAELVEYSAQEGKLFSQMKLD
jgi:hypothetical protein